MEDNLDGTPQEGTPAPTTPPADVKFDEWYKSLEAPYRAAVDNHVTGLKTALGSERESRKGLEKQLRELSKQVEKGSELATQVDKMTNDLTQSERRTAFYEQAHMAGVKNLRLAWLAALDGDLINTQGEVDLGKLKEQAPELFAAPKPIVPPGNAGSGAGSPPAAGPTMNEFIRAAAGRK